MTIEAPVDIRHRVTDRCNAACTYCFNESIPINRRRGGTVEQPRELTLLQALRLYDAIYRRIEPARIRVHSHTGGEPTLWGDDLVSLMGHNIGSGEMGVYLNTNATLVTSKYADKLVDIGLRQANVNFPSMNHVAHVETFRRDLLDRQILGVNAMIDRGIGVDINLPLVVGINDSLEQMLAYKQFFVRQVRPDQVLLKYFWLLEGMYGDGQDRLFHQGHAVSTSIISDRLRPYEIEPVDFGRRRMFRYPVDGINMLVAVVSDPDPNHKKNHVTGDGSFMISPEGHLFRTFDRVDVPVDYQNDVKLQADVDKALTKFEISFAR